MTSETNQRNNNSYRDINDIIGDIMANLKRTNEVLNCQKKEREKENHATPAS